jgi:serine/threonine-protein kinase SRPK3
MNGLKLKALGKKQKWFATVKEKNNETDSEDDLSSDDEFKVSQGVVYTILNNQYIPLKYLGRGTFSRVWLAYDIPNNRLVAMKSVFTKFKDDGRDEIITNNYIRKQLDFVNNDIRLLEFYDSFLLKSGETCLIYELMGVTMLEIMDYYDDTISINIVKRISIDILNGMKQLHGINRIHTDLKPENILTNIYNRGITMYKTIFETDNNFNHVYDTLINDLLPENYSTLDKNKKKKLKRNIKIKAAKQLISHIKSKIDVVIDTQSTLFFEETNNETDLNKIDIDDIDTDEESITFKDYLKEIDIDESVLANTIQVKIIDFGNCENPDKLIQDEICVRNYRPPENFMNSYFNEKADIWTYGCILFEFLTGDYLFSIEHTDNTNKRDRLYLFEMFQTLGKIPRDISDNCEFVDDLFDTKGRILKMKHCEYTSIKNILMNDYEYNDTDAQEIHSFLHTLLDYDIKKRASATEALNSEWLICK